MESLLTYLKMAVPLFASDIFMIAGAPISAKVDKGLIQLNGDEKLMPPDTVALLQEAYSLAERSMKKLEDTGDDDFSFAVSGLARFRVNAYRQRGSLASVIRIIPFNIPDWRALGIPEGVMNTAEMTHGMVLVTGTAGSGKSTTQACIIDRINSTRACHIVTLEDPIEFLHRDKKSIISQREISIDTSDCASALRACLRQAPDVILVGEMRDAETIRAAITAAETGHLVLGTLHTRGAVNSIDRIIDSFPPESQHQIRLQLSMVLNTVVSQQLLPGEYGDRIAAFEVMHTNTAIRSMIRDSKTHMINNAIATGGTAGMITMDESIARLCNKGLISSATALWACDEPEQLKRRIGIF